MRKRFYPPSQLTWWISLILVALGIIMYLGIIKVAFISGLSFWITVASSVLLLIATRIRAL